MTDAGGADDDWAIERPRVLDPNRRKLLKAAGTGAFGLGSVSAADATVARSSSESAQGTSVTLVPADSDSGFHYPYYLYAPDTDDERERPLLVEPNNTGTATDDFEVHRQSARDLIEHGFCRRISDELRVPLLVPVFPRPQSNPVSYRHYVHALDAETMGISSGKLARVDEQLLAMIRDAQDRLADGSYPSGEKIIMNGFSASGNFVNRFTALHPEIVESVSAGGINGTAILPRAAAEGKTLKYPVGIADLESLVGREFDQNAWREVSQFIYMGAEDENDTIPYDDAWSDEHREIALAVYGDDMQEDRMPYCRSTYEEAGASARFEVYPGVGHRIPSGIREDVIAFHRRSLETFFVEFRTPPSAGDTTIEVVVSTGRSSGIEEFDVRAFDDDGNELSNSAVTVGPNDGLEAEIELGDEIRMDETVTVALSESGASDLDRAIASAKRSVLGDVRFAAEPTAGDPEVTAEYALSESYETKESISVGLETEQGARLEFADIRPGEAGTATDVLDESAAGVPLRQDTEVTISLVDGNPITGTTIAAETTIVGAPSSVAIGIDVDADRVVEAGDPLAVEASIRGLGGSAEELPITVAANDTVVETVTVSIDSGETKTRTISVPTGRVEANEITVSVSGAGASGRSTTVLAVEPAVGDGSEARPYAITDGNELAYVDIDRTSHFELAADVDLSGFENFVRIGELGDEFSGTFDGRSNEIRNLRIDRSLEQFEGVGLFGNVLGGTIKDVQLVNANVTGDDFVGGVVGMASAHGEISGVSVSGTIDGERNVGGIVGGTSTGGAAEKDVVISEAISNAHVRGRSKIGGIIGQSSGDPVEKSYATGTVSGSRSVAGILGRSDFGGVVTESYATASIEGDGGGIVATNADGTVSDSYWDTETTGKATSDGGEGLSTDEMIGEAAAESMDGFDFDETWETVVDPDDYPTLQGRARLVSDSGSVSVEIVDPSDGDRVPVDDPLQVSVDVTRTEGVEDTSTVALTAPGDRIEADVTLDSGESETIDFTVPADDVRGTFLVAVESADDSDALTVTGRGTDNSPSASVGFADQPIAGESEVTVVYSVAGSSEGEGPVRIRLSVEGDDSSEIALDTIDPGEATSETFAVGGLDDAVPFEEGQRLKLAIVDEGSSADEPLAFNETTVGSSERATDESDANGGDSGSEDRSSDAGEPDSSGDTERDDGNGRTNETMPGPGVLETLATFGGATYLLKRRLGDNET